MGTIPAGHLDVGNFNGVEFFAIIDRHILGQWAQVELLSAAASDRGGLLVGDASSLLALGEGSLHAFGTTASPGVLHSALLDLGALPSGALRPFAPPVAGEGADAELSAHTDWE